MSDDRRSGARGSYEPPTVRLDAATAAAARVAVRTLADRLPDVTDPAFLNRLPLHAAELPRPVRELLVDFRAAETAGACVVRGFPVDDGELGPTPGHWADVPAPSAVRSADFWLLLCAGLLGEPFAWATQQGGRLVHEVVPIRGHEDEQINSASRAPLLWHTEDAFHPYRADYIGLMCLRNPSRAATTVADLGAAVIDDDQREVLFQPRFVLRPDASHRPEHGDTRTPDPAAARRYAGVRRLLDDAPRVPLLFGAPDRPYIRLDSDAVERPDDDPAAAAALDHLAARMEAVLRDVVLAPGDLLFVDNYRAVHGRRSFTASFDGRDRWLKRVNVTRDLRRSRDARSGPTDRVIR